MLHTSLGACLRSPNYGIQKQASRMNLAKQQDELSSVIILGHKQRRSSNKGIITHWKCWGQCISVAAAPAPTAATPLSSHDIILAADCQRGSKATSILNDSFNKEGKIRMRSCRLPASLDPGGGAAPAGRPPDDHDTLNDKDHDDDDYNNNNMLMEFLGTVSKRLNTLYQFSRPHTIIGTIIGISSVSLLPIQSFADFSPAFFAGLLKAMVPSILMNVYVVGLNQLFDVDIDKVNKPKLPLASGEFSMETGSIIVTVCSLLSFAIGFMSQSPPLLLALTVSFLLGSAYSVDLPLLRWKKQAVLAAFCIVMVRAMLVQLAFFIHFQKYVLGRDVMLTRSVIFATAFMCFFATVIALFKDIPDADGDRDFEIQSFTVRLGKHKVFWLCINLLSLAYGAASVLGVFSPLLKLPTKFVVVIGHSALASILWLRAQSVDLRNNVSVASFYMFIWKLFYAEYFLIPFVR